MDALPPSPGRPRSIKFPMRKERTGNRRGPRFVLRPDPTGLDGSAFCANRMISLAMDARDEARGIGTWAKACPRTDRLADLTKRIAKWRMRYSALMARLFVNHIDKDDPRLVAIHAEHEAHMRELHDSRSAN